MTQRLPKDQNIAGESCQTFMPATYLLHQFDNRKGPSALFGSSKSSGTRIG